MFPSRKCLTSCLLKNASDNKFPPKAAMFLLSTITFVFSCLLRVPLVHLKTFDRRHNFPQQFDVCCELTEEVERYFLLSPFPSFFDSICSASKFNNAARDKNFLFLLFLPRHLTAHNITTVQGIKGLSSGVFYDNLMPSFLDVILINLLFTLTNFIET